MKINVRTIGDEKGIALVLALFLTAAASVLAASLMYLAQTETYASVNYRNMTQARYAAESGIHKTVNYLLNTYAGPFAGSVTDPLTAYNMNVSPVTLVAGGQPVVLSASDDAVSNYPVAAVKTAFLAAAAGSLPVGQSNVQYTPYARLMAMRQLTDGTVAMTWQIVSKGTMAFGSSTADVEVSAVLEKQVVLTVIPMYAAFATDANCGALKFAGGAMTDSYDSSALVGGNPAIAASGGNVGTNGNLTESGGATINGALSTSRVGVGACSAGNVTAETASGGATVTGGIIQLPQVVAVPTPPLPDPLPPTTNTNLTGGSTTYAPGNYGNIKLSGSAVLHVSAGTYNINSLSTVGSSNLVIDSGPVIFNVVGTGETTPIDLTGGSVSNATYDASKLQFLYAGTDNVNLAGGTQMAAIITAPNAAVNLSGNADFYGSVLGKTVTDTGGMKIHFDRHLNSTMTSATAGNDMLSSFSWKKY